MVDPASALLFSVLLIAAGLAVLWPKKGLYARLKSSKQRAEQVLIEDALKHLYDLDYRGQAGTIESVSGALAISRDAAATLLARLEKRHFLTTKDQELQLTPAGKAEALRIIRAHRLWETYLADHTGLQELDWHQQAEVREHTTSHAEIEDLAGKTGDPVFDPHGDPIPTDTGELPPRKGMLLTALPANKLGSIVHLEDEPENVHRELVRRGLHPGQKIQLLEKTPEHIKCIVDGRELVMQPVVARNITVVLLPPDQQMTGPYDTLDMLELRECGTVLGISKACRGMQRRRLMDLGVLPGTVICAELRNGAGDPTAYRIRGAMIALRREQAKLIYVKREETG